MILNDNDADVAASARQEDLELTVTVFARALVSNIVNNY